MELGGLQFCVCPGRLSRSGFRLADKPWWELGSTFAHETDLPARIPHNHGIGRNIANHDCARSTNPQRLMRIPHTTVAFAPIVDPSSRAYARHVADLRHAPARLFSPATRRWSVADGDTRLNEGLVADVAVATDRGPLHDTGEWPRYLTFGIAAAFLLERMDNSITSPDIAQAVSRWPFLGVVPLLNRKIAKKGMLRLPGENDAEVRCEKREESRRGDQSPLSGGGNIPVGAHLHPALVG